MDIKPLNHDQLEDALGVILRAFGESYRAMAEFELNWSLTNDPSYYRPQTFVAIVNGTVAGVIQCASNYAHSDTYSIGWVATDPLLQGQGIGKALVKYAENHIAQNMLYGKPGTILIADDTRLARPDGDFYLKMGYIDGPISHKGVHLMIKVVNGG